MQQQGADVEIREQVVTVWERHDDGDRLRAVKDMDCDVAVFQRVFHRHSQPWMKTDQGVSLELIRAVQAQGIAVVVDLDDDLGAIDPRHAGYHVLEGVGPIVSEACRLADLVTVSTPALAKRYGNGRGRVIPNCVPAAYLGIGRTEIHQVPMVGWTGTPATHVGDLEVVGSTIRDLVKEGQIAFRAIGDRRTLDILGVPKQRSSPGASLSTFDYARLYAQLDLAIVPLRPTRFNAGKSWLKGAEAAALGVPVVMSPTPENVRLHGLGVGILAERPRDWYEHLKRLPTAPTIRHDLAGQGRVVMADWTIEGRMSSMCWDAWTGARALRASRPCATVA